jgi:hypothetical protein
MESIETNTNERKVDRVKWLAYLIIGLSTLLRLFYASTISFSPEEVFSIFQFSDHGFSGFLDHLTERGENHPVVAQILFGMWYQIMPAHEFFVRLPYVLLGSMGMWWAYLLFSGWFGRKIAVMVLTLMGFAAMNMVFGIYARPFVLGMALVMFAAWRWDRVINRTGQIPLKKGLFLGFAWLIAAHSHYGALMVVGIMVVTSLLFITPKNMHALGAAALILALGLAPFYGIGRHHFTMATIGPHGLPVPDPQFRWIIDWILYLVNHSWFVFLTLLGIMVYARPKAYEKKANWRASRYHMVLGKTQIIWLSAALGFLPFIGLLFYSFVQKPVFHTSLILPTFPFMAAFIFQWAYPFFRKMPTYLMGAFSVVVLFTSFTEKEAFNIMPFTHFKQAISDIEDQIEKTPKTAVLMVSPNPEVLRYFIDEDSPIKRLGRIFHPDSLDHNLSDWMTNTKQQGQIGLVYAWFDEEPAVQVPTQIRAFYPNYETRKRGSQQAQHYFSTLPVKSTILRDLDTLLSYQRLYKSAPIDSMLSQPSIYMDAGPLRDDLNPWTEVVGKVVLQNLDSIPANIQIHVEVLSDYGANWENILTAELPALTTQSFYVGRKLRTEISYKKEPIFRLKTNPIASNGQAGKVLVLENYISVVVGDEKNFPKMLYPGHQKR